MDVLIFKAGYDHVGFGPWDSFKVSKYFKERIKWEGEKAIIPLRKLTMEERKKRGVPDYIPSEAPKNKVIKMLKEINKERIEQGLKPYKIWRGEEI